MKKLLILVSMFITLNSYAQKFREIISHPFPTLTYADYAAADVDNDRDMDIVASGFNQPNSNTTETKLYINDGCGNFTISSSNSFIGVLGGTVEFLNINHLPQIIQIGVLLDLEKHPIQIGLSS
jgi:hypothetical protein